jgi:acyl-coenzyme A synthetase/AMP-(fatty) acid ligase
MRPDAGTYDLSSLRMFAAGGDCVPVELQNRFRDLFGIVVDELCGMTEVMYCNQPFNQGERRSIAECAMKAGIAITRSEDLSFATSDTRFHLSRHHRLNVRPLSF